MLITWLLFLFSFRREAVTEAATSKWPGNNIPKFKNNKEAQKELEELVETLLAECTFEPIGLNKESIKQHIGCVEWENTPTS